MQRFAVRRRRRPRSWARLLSTSFAIAVGLARVATAEPPPTFQLEWSIVPNAGQTAVPQGAAVDATGNLTVAVRSPQSVQSYTSSGAFITGFELLQVGTCPKQPRSVDVDGSGNTYVIDFGCNRLSKVDSNRALSWAIGSLGAGNGQFNSPSGVALGLGGALYVADTFNQRVQKFDANGGYVMQWGSEGSAGGQFLQPIDVATDASGNVYVLDSFNQRVQVFTSAGVLLRMFGEPGFGSDHLIQPQGLDVDAAGNVYVADTGNNQIVKFGPTGDRLAVWGGGGSAPGQMSGPLDVAVDGAGNVFVVDSGNKRIQKFSSPPHAELHVEPRTINARSGGKWITAYIEPPPPYGPGDIQVSSLTLNGVAVDPAAPVGSGDVDADGVPELVVRFSRVDVAATAPSGVTDLTLSLSGTVGTVGFTAQDVVKMVGNGEILTWDPGIFSSRASRLGLDANAFGVRIITPNPVRAGSSMLVSYRASGHGRASIDVIDLQGRRVGRTDMGQGTGGASLGTVTLHRSLAPGLYLIRLIEGTKVATAKFAVVH